MHLLFQRKRILRVSSRDGFRSIHAVANLYFLHVFADRLDHARAVRARSVGKRRLLRISAAAHVRVVGIYARRMNAREHLRSEEHTSELQSLTNLVCRL